LYDGEEALASSYLFMIIYYFFCQLKLYSKAASCRKYNLKLGMYLSPWDCSEASYGSGKEYDDFFCNQLTELMTNYGELFCLWFDGACGEGPNGKRQEYDWGRYFRLIRKLQPGAVIASMGPDVRWCGNEAGICRESEFSVVPRALADIEFIQSMSQQQEGADFATIVHERCVEDIGSRKALEGVTDLVWYPAEVDYSIRPGWFYHPEEDDQVRSFDRLREVYLSSVGGNAAFLLNVPPNKEGLLHTNDVNRLRELGDWIRGSFSHNYLAGATFSSSSEEEGFEVFKISNENDNNLKSRTWKSSEEDSSPTVIVKAKAEFTPKYLVLQEDTTFSQRIERFTLYCLLDNEWKMVVKGTTVGHKRISPIEVIYSSDTWRLEVNKSRLGATLKTFALY
jgi:alpha-L-fucosidase